MSASPSTISDELYALLRQHFAEEQLVELAAKAALENYRARFNRVFDVGSDGLYGKGLHFKLPKAVETGPRPIRRRSHRRPLPALGPSCSIGSPSDGAHGATLRRLSTAYRPSTIRKSLCAALSNTLSATLYSSLS